MAGRWMNYRYSSLFHRRQAFDPDREQTLFHPAEMELAETVKLIFDRVNEIEPARVVVPLSRS